MDISNWITHRAAWSPDKTAIKFEGREISYARMEEEVGRLAGFLRDEIGVGRGDRVAHLGYNSPEMLEMLFACARLGAIFVPLNWRLTPHEHLWILKNCTPKVLFAEPDFHESIEGIRDQAGELALVAMEKPRKGWRDYEKESAAAAPIGPDPSIPLELPVTIVYTSGTTGTPKGAVMTQEALFYNAVNSIGIFNMTSDDVILTVLPMFHVGAMNIQTTPAIHAGATVVMLRRFEPDPAIAALKSEPVTLMVAVPAVSTALTTHPEWDKLDLSTMRCACTGSSTVPEAIPRPWLERGIPVTQVYGLTESCPIATAVPIERGMTHSLSAGLAVPHCQARLIDENGEDVPVGQRGELVLRGPNILKEYWQNPTATDLAFIDGWFRTGDVAHQDEEGFFYVDDRKKDVIISGGENIYPAELENVLADCPKFEEFTVIGRPDEKWGETPVVVAVLKDGATMTADEVIGLFDGRLARYKHPHHVAFVEGPLPRTSLGKVQKFEVRQMLGV